MKTILQILIAASLLIISACGNNARTKQELEKNSTTDSSLSENAGHKIDYNNTQVLETVYVIDREGVEMKQDADENSKIMGTYNYGDKLDVIEETEKWLGIRDRITRKFVKNGDEIVSTGWEMIYVLKNKTGSINEIRLIPSDLNIISSLSVAGQESKYFEKGQQLNKYLKIELVDEQLFESRKDSAVNFLLADTAIIEKKNGTIELQCQVKVVRYVDNPTDNDGTREFQYIGQIEFLNKYLIYGLYWESSNYIFVDKISGEETSFGEFPYISPNKQNIISIYANPYETTADLELYSISENNSIKQIMNVSFINWMPTVEKGEMFWSTDGYLYLTVNHTKLFGEQSGSLNNKCQYIRIKIL